MLLWGQLHLAVGISSFGARAVAQVPVPKKIVELSPEERQAELARTGFSGLRTYADVLTDLSANEIACDLYREKIEEIIDNPDMVRLSMEYLVATYGPDKLNNPGAA